MGENIETWNLMVELLTQKIFCRWRLNQELDLIDGIPN